MSTLNADESGNRHGIEFQESSASQPTGIDCVGSVTSEGRGIRMASKTGSSPMPAYRASRTRAITLDDKMTFFQQLSTLICSGTPMLQAIQISAEQSQSLKLRRVLERLPAACRPAARCTRPRPAIRRCSRTTGSR